MYLINMTVKEDKENATHICVCEYVAWCLINKMIKIKDQERFKK